MTYRTGKLPPKPDPRAPKMARLYGDTLPTAPEICDWISPVMVAKPMFCNNVLGCCTWSAVANRERVLSANVRGEEYLLPDATVSGEYLGMTGGADTGLYMTDVCSHLASKGLVFPGRQYEDVPSWATVDHTNGNELRLGIAWFGGLMGGFNLPGIDVEAQFDAGIPWDVPDDIWALFQAGKPLPAPWTPGAGGGHEMYGAAYVSDGIVFLTWGGHILVTNRFISVYMDEAQVLVSRLWLETTGAAPDGLDLGHLEACMNQIRQGAVV